MNTGKLPGPLVQIYLVLLDKPRKPPELCNSKRPISLISLIAKMLEATVLNRLMEQLELGLDECQYAYRRERGTEHHLLEMSDFVRQMRSQNRFTSITSIDVNGAFDTVPHKSLMRTVESLGVSPHVCRYLAQWLSSRVFRIRLATPGGRFYSSWRSLSQGLP